jgi:hypothetical protein
MDTECMAAVLLRHPARREVAVGQVVPAIFPGNFSLEGCLRWCRFTARDRALAVVCRRAPVRLVGAPRARATAACWRHPHHHLRQFVLDILGGGQREAEPTTQLDTGDTRFALGYVRPGAEPKSPRQVRRGDTVRWGL